MRNFYPVLALVLASCGAPSAPKEEAANKLTQSPLGGASGIVVDNPAVPPSNAFDLLSGVPTGAGTASLVGTPPGASGAPSKAFFDALAVQAGQADQAVFAVVLLSTRSDACTIAINSGLAASDTSLAFILSPAADANAPAGSLQQTYPVVDPNSLSAATGGGLALLAQTDATCQPTLTATGASGQVGVQSIAFAAPESAVGQFNVTFSGAAGASGSLTGAFNAAPCPGLAALYAAQLTGGGVQPTCKP